MQKYVENSAPNVFLDTTPMQTEEIKLLIENGLTDSQAYVEGDGTHFTAYVKCPAFTGKSRLQKQQMVYDTVKAQLLDGSLHALSIKTFTLEEWNALENQDGEA